MQLETLYRGYTFAMDKNEPYRAAEVFEYDCFPSLL